MCLAIAYLIIYIYLIRERRLTADTFCIDKTNEIFQYVCVFIGMANKHTNVYIAYIYNACKIKSYKTNNNDNRIAVFVNRQKITQRKSAASQPAGQSIGLSSFFFGWAAIYL